MSFENQYLNYSEYGILGGKLEKMPFNLLEFEARKIVDRYTSGRLKNLSSQLDETKMCINALISKIKGFNDKGNIASESVDGYSVTFVSPLTEEQEKEVHMLVINYLSDCELEDGTPYLYCGVDR